ncbi:carbohydrate esterase family 4 protein [Mycena maculata]|uniref:chitin deacetylase n=1 Tax=Mycena maculata TaxID=230809 RepID=A0AAD7JHL5_9AGAR|nr:carbohydrate esterase family 4 protein [Mycena maculata]
MKPQALTTTLFWQSSAAAAKTPTVVAGVTIPPLASITFGIPTDAATATSTAGATPAFSGAPVLPSPAWVFSNTSNDWPTMDIVADPSAIISLSQLNQLNNLSSFSFCPTADASNRGWWTCGDKMTWGVSFDDGPSPYSNNLLSYLVEKNLSATFFIVGSHMIEYPQTLISEYMAGNEISIHTWKHLMALTNAEIVAELGWTYKAIQSVSGVTPMMMQLRTVTSVAGGTITGEASYAEFQSILGNAIEMDTRFIVLQHDLYEITVDMAMGYTLNTPIGKCSDILTLNLYVKSNTNTSFLFPSPPTTSNSTSSASSSAKVQGSTSSSGSSGALANVTSIALVGGAVLGSWLLL